MSDVFGIGNAVSGAAQAGATIAAAGIQADAENNATNAQTTAFNTITANNKPFLDTGTSALSQLGAAYGLNGGGGTPGAIDPNAGFYQSPDYQFQLSQGIKGVDAGAAAGGMLDSGATRKAEIAYAGNLASGQFNTYANRLQAIAGIGQAAANNQGAAAQGYANNIGNLAQAGANNLSNSVGNLAGQLGSSNRSAASSSYSGASAGGINGPFRTGGTFGPDYTGDGNGEF